MDAPLVNMSDSNVLPVMLNGTSMLGLITEVAVEPSFRELLSSELTTSIKLPLLNSTTDSELSGIMSLGPHSAQTTVAESTVTPSYAPWASSGIIDSIFVVSGCISIVITIANVVLLLMSKYTNGGRTPVLIFVRSLCVADALTGIFGISKMSQVFIRWENTNCFLPESLLFAATIAFNLTHVMLTTMCYSMLKDLLRFDQKQDKQRSVFSMTFLWNGSFIIGFVPHMGWNQDRRMGWNTTSHVCLFIMYFDRAYISFVTTIIGVCLLWLLVLNIALHVLITHRRFGEPTLLTLAWPVIRAMRVDLALQLLCYTPGALYLFLPCKSCAYGAEPHTASANLYVFMPLMILRALCSTTLHTMRTPQIRDVFAHTTKMCLHQILLTLGMSTKSKRPKRRVRNISFIETKSRNKMGPSQTMTIPQHYCWQQGIKDRTHLPKQTINSYAPTSGQHPTIHEEPTMNNASIHSMYTEADLPNLTPSQSMSNMTMVTTLGSSVQSTTSTNGTDSSGSSRKTSIKTHGVDTNGIHVSRSLPTQLQHAQIPPATSTARPYWAGSLPHRTSQPSASTQLSTRDFNAGFFLSSQHQLLWARPSMGTTSLMHGVTSPTDHITKREDAESKPHSDNRSTLSRTNTLESEVIVHAPADT